MASKGRKTVEKENSAICEVFEKSCTLLQSRDSKYEDIESKIEALKEEKRRNRRENSSTLEEKRKVMAENSKDLESRSKAIEEKRRSLAERAMASEARGRILAEKRQKMKERRRTLDQDLLKMEQRSIMLEESWRQLEMCVNIDDDVGSTISSVQKRQSSPLPSIVGLKKFEQRDKEMCSRKKGEGKTKDCLLELSESAPTKEKDKYLDLPVLSIKRRPEIGTHGLSKEDTMPISPSTLITRRKSMSIADLKDRLNQKKKELAERRASRLFK
uniref:Uncharacterized protein n=1 Tax=Strongyloides venezuelensis TaxID=75913 RepID=A0A0K0EW28_STRVS